MMTESNTAAFTKPELPMHIQQIREYLPHRYPFLLVDRVVDVTDNAIVIMKNKEPSLGFSLFIIKPSLWYTWFYYE